MRSCEDRRVKKALILFALVAAGASACHELELRNRLFRAVDAGDLAAVGACIQKTPRLIDSGNLVGDTPLIRAVAAGRVDVSRLLIEEGADIGKKDLMGGTALHKAAAMGHADLVTLLLRSGADVRAGDRKGRTPLHHAARHGQFEAVRLLIAGGAELNAEDRLGETPIEKARLGTHFTVTKLLEDSGADPRLKSCPGCKKKE